MGVVGVGVGGRASGTAIMHKIYVGKNRSLQLEKTVPKSPKIACVAFFFWFKIQPIIQLHKESSQHTSCDNEVIPRHAFHHRLPVGYPALSLDIL